MNKKVEEIKEYNPDFSPVWIFLGICLVVICVGMFVASTNMASNTNKLITNAQSKLDKIQTPTYSDDMSQLLSSLLLKQMTVSGDGSLKLGGSFDGRFTTKIDRTLEKVNLSCIDEYQYRTSINPEGYIPNSEDYVNQVRWFEQLKDMGCSAYRVAGNVSYFKCPKHNCPMKEVDAEKSGSFIPQRVILNNIGMDASFNGMYEK